MVEMILREQKGITAGTAVLIIAIVAAGIGGGLYLVTQFRDSEEKNRRDKVKDKFIILQEFLFPDYFDSSG